MNKPASGKCMKGPEGNALHLLTKGSIQTGKSCRFFRPVIPRVRHNKMKIKMISLLICCLTFHIGCAEKSSLPKAKDIVEFKVNSISPHARVKDFKIEKRDLEHIITTYYQISEENWRHS